MPKIIVTGWRRAEKVAVERNRDAIREALGAIWSRPRWSDAMTLLHGDGEGVDQLAAQIATADWGWHVQAYPADWSTCGEGCPDRPHLRTRGGVTYCPYAGHRRNEAMCAAGADLLLAFPGPGSKGTWDCLRRAAAHGIPARVYPLRGR